MKIFILFPIFCILLMSSIQHGYAFLGDEFSLNMYENIDEGINDLEETIYIKQLRTDKTGNTVEIRQKISELVASEEADIQTGVECYVESEISSTAVKNIQDGRIDKLFNSINEECKGEKEDLTLEYFMLYYNKTKELSLESERIAKEQAKAISEIARIGIYSDGNEENSPFDLIVDLQRINNIIFSKEIPYLGILPGGNLNDSGLNENAAPIGDNFGENFQLEGLSLGVEANAQANGDGQTSIIDLPAGNAFGLPGDGQNLVCIDSSDSSGLSPETIIDLTTTGDDAPVFVPTSDFIGITEGTDDGGGDGSQTGNTYPNVEYPENEYVKMKDNDRWPCKEFFCIRVEFVTETYNLLVGGKTKSIESLIKTSNEHLKKFAHTSLVQGKMTVNNFETSHRDLNLPDLFNAGVQIQFIPPPILDLDKVEGDNSKQTQDLGDDFTLDNLLTTYFENHSMNYERENDLQRFLETAEDRNNVSNSQELSINATQDQFDKARLYKENERTSFARNILDKRANNTDAEELFLQFAEIERFAVGIQDYSFAADAIINKMNEIPIHSNG